MRRLLQRTVGPPLEAVFRYFEQTVTLEDHADLVVRFVSQLARARSEYPATLWPHAANECIALARAQGLCEREEGASRPTSASLEPPDPGAAFASAFETGAAQEAVHLTTLLRGEIFCAARPGSEGDESDSPAMQAMQAEEWQEDPAAVNALRVAGTRILAGLRTGRLSRDAADRRLGPLTRGFPPRRWFLARGPLYGSANLLRALIEVAAGDPAAAAYTRDVCDRLLRHVEVRRADCLRFRVESRPADACDALEKLRFTHALLDASACFGDPRYLNAALKANDWHCQGLSGRGLVGAASGRPETAMLLRLFYVESVCRQEARMREGFGP